jgi:hypothetical protein
MSSSRPTAAPRKYIGGHDFGAMDGALAAAVDPRVTAVVYMAGTSIKV